MIVQDEAINQADEGENYFISMTDMMVGVRFIFIIMLMTFALDFRRTTDVQEDALKVAQEVVRKLDALQTDVREQLARMDKAERDRSRLLNDIREQLAAEGLTVQVDEANGVLRLTEDAVRFAPNRADLVDHNKENVDKIARVFERVLPKYAPCRAGEPGECKNGVPIETLFMEGHTDTTGIDADNWQLSTARAVNTYRD